MCSPLFKFSHLYKIGNPECQELIFIFFPELRRCWCHVFSNHLPFITDQRETGSETRASLRRTLPPHPELLVPSRVHCSINGKRRVVMKRQTGSKFHRHPELLVEAPAVFVNKQETAIHNGKRQRDPELLVWRRMLVMNEDSSYFIPTGNGNGVRCAVYLYEFW